jgi:site-specific recombinase XerC
VTLEQLDAQLIVDFLSFLETTRNNGPNSRNTRLSTIKSFMHYMEFRVPSALEQIRRVLALPVKKTASRLVKHLTAEELQAILNAPLPTDWDGIRDRAMLHLCFAGALRVALVERNGISSAILAGGQGQGLDARIIPQCSWRTDDTFWFRIHPSQACQNGCRPLPIPDRKTRIPTCIEAYLCIDCPASDQRYS